MLTPPLWTFHAPQFKNLCFNKNFLNFLVPQQFFLRYRIKFVPSLGSDTGSAENKEQLSNFYLSTSKLIVILNHLPVWLSFD